MKILFAVSNENISESIVKKYQKDYKEIISYKNVYYFNAILKEIQKDKSYDRIIISEDLEPFANNNYDAIDKFLFDKLDSISDEATGDDRNDTPIILICTDRRNKSEDVLVKLFGIGIYNAVIGKDRSIDEICRLIRNPRTKKEAKVYYQIDSDEVNYQSENENDVSESEIQNIIAHYKKLGKNEDKYVDSFNNIAAQYTDIQLKLIASFLPLNVKAVLESNSPKYQQLVMKGGVSSAKVKNNSKLQVPGSGIKVNYIENKDGKQGLSKPVIVPEAVNINKVKKFGKKVENTDYEDKFDNLEERNNDINNSNEDNYNSDSSFDDNSNYDQNNIENKVNDQDLNMDEPVRRRGRPRKTPLVESEGLAVNKKMNMDFKPINTNLEEEIIPETPKKGRGRPRKNPVVETKIMEKVEEPINLFGLDEDDEEENEIIKDNNDTGFVLPGLEDDEEEQPAINIYEDRRRPTDRRSLNESVNSYKPTINNQSANLERANQNSNSYTNNINANQENRQYNNYIRPQPNNNQEQIVKNDDNKDYSQSDIENLMSGDKKIVAFLGTSKNGVSFLVNNMAELLSSMGINTAILDTTKNRNSFYIYTKNEEELRKVASDSIPNLVEGIDEGIKVNKNLSVYTSVPNRTIEIEEYKEILSTLVQNHSLVLIDCDFETDYGYFSNAQEIYLVQSMDVLTIQPLTEFLRELKSRDIIKQEKIKVVINKQTKVKSLTEKIIIGGMSYYNDPEMSFMTELFDRDLVKYCKVPFDEDVYSRYLEGLVNCKISLSGYPKEFMLAMKQLGSMIYPLIGSKQAYAPMGDKSEYGSAKFSNNMNDTLDKMKKKY